MHYYEQNIGDYRKDTGHLTLLEHGIYRQLLDTYYLSEKPLPLDHAKLMRSHCVRTAEEVQALENVLADFFIRTDDGYSHKRCDEVIQSFKAKSEKASNSAKARWNKTEPQSPVNSECNANAMRPHSDSNANHKPITINQEPSLKPLEKFEPATVLLDLGVDKQIVLDWLAHRKALKAQSSMTVIKSRVDEAGKARISLDDALSMEVSNNWKGFKAEYAKPKPLQAGRLPAPTREQSTADNEEAFKMLFGKNQTEVIDV